MLRIRQNDIVVLLKEPESSINRYARVVKVEEHHVLVSNMNQPWNGTLANHRVPKHQVQTLRRERAW